MHYIFIGEVKRNRCCPLSPWHAAQAMTELTPNTTPLFGDTRYMNDHRGIDIQMDFYDIKNNMFYKGK